MKQRRKARRQQSNLDGATPDVSWTSPLTSVGRPDLDVRNGPVGIKRTSLRSQAQRPMTLASVISRRYCRDITELLPVGERDIQVISLRYFDDIAHVGTHVYLVESGSSSRPDMPYAPAGFSGQKGLRNHVSSLL